VWIDGDEHAVARPRPSRETPQAMTAKRMDKPPSCDLETRSLVLRSGRAPRQQAKPERRSRRCATRVHSRGMSAIS
jgi:hypothetical protein